MPNGNCSDPVKQKEALKLDFDYSKVPEEYHEIINCVYTFSAGEVENDTVDCVICSSIGHLLEFRGKRLIASCELSSKEAQKIKPMITYERNIGLVYIVQLPEHQLEIVCRTPRLKSMRVEQDVVEWEVGDFACLGLPQLRVRGGSDAAWQRVPLTEKPQALPDGLKDISTPLEATLQTLREKLRRSQTLLEDKRALRASLVKPPAGDSLGCQPLTLLACHYALLHGRLILVVKLRHNRGPLVTDLRLLVAGTGTLQQVGPSVLKGDQDACLVGAFASGSSSPPRAAVAGTSGERELFVPLPPPPPIDPLSDELKIERLGLADLCLVLTSCSGASQRLELGQNVWGFLETRLPRMGCLLSEDRDRGVWRLAGGGELGGGFLVTQTASHSLVACCRDSAQLGLVLLALSSLLPEGCPLKPCDEDSQRPPPPATSGAAALRHELSWLTQLSQLKEVSSEKYRSFLQELARRGAITDQHFAPS